MREMQKAGRDRNEKVTGKLHRHLPDGEASETGRLITKSRRWWRKAVSTGTFRMGIRGRAGEGGLWGRAAYNEIQKVVEKGRFNRHLPDGDPGQGRRGRPLGQGGL